LEDTDAEEHTDAGPSPIRGLERILDILSGSLESRRMYSASRPLAPKKGSDKEA